MAVGIGSVWRIATFPDDTVNRDSRAAGDSPKTIDEHRTVRTQFCGTTQGWATSILLQFINNPIHHR